jgi:hypothetical protein
MPCYHPMQAYPSSEPNANGKRPLQFSRPHGFTGEAVEIPCAKCIGCRLERSRQWALRCVHEASMYQENCFITLTYASENVPKYGTLKLDDWQKFMKRFRKANPEKQIRFFMCGEYGENLEHSKNGKFGHPHYHACIFNYDFPDKYLYSYRNGIKLFRSETLEKLWPFGYSSIGDVTFESAAYVARYVMKKQLGKNSKKAYEFLDEETGEIINLKPEFTTMSRGGTGGLGGIGKPWYEKYKGDLKKDFITSRGVKMRPPKFYDGLLEKEDPLKIEKLKEERKQRAIENQSDDYYRRLDDAEKIKSKKIKQLIRKI